MATDTSPRQTERRRPAAEDVCPLECKSLRPDRDTRKSPRAFTPHTGSSTTTRQEEERTPASGGKVWKLVTMETSESSEDELGRLDIDLDRKSKQHNLTSSNVRAILHEVITHERVVAMMKAAIRDTQDLPMFEPQMTRSRLKQAIQQGQPLNWSLPAVKATTVKPPQFVDIDLEEDEDSSDEEYCPDEEEDDEDDTAEETLPSDADSLASPPRIHQDLKPRPSADQSTNKPTQRSPGQLGEQVVASACALQHQLTVPETSFLERLNAVEEELNCSSAYTYNQLPPQPPYTYNQYLNRKDDNDVRDECSSCLAYRTRSKLPLVNVPLGQLEAKLLAPDITADMYEQSAAWQEEDHHWTRWLQGLMAPDNGEEADDDDDPEYNFLDDLDEPDLEDYRTDRAVQITKKEVNELLDELFDTLQEEEQEEEAPSQTGPKFNVPQALRFEAPLATMLTERRRTVRKQYEALQQRRALQDTTNHHHDDTNMKETSNSQSDTITSVLVLPSRACPTLHLDYTQKLQLQQQIQQHVQLLTQVHLLCRRVDALNHEACITKHYLEELQQFARRREDVFLPSSFRVCNLQGALDLLQEVGQKAEPPPAPPAPAASRRWLPRMSPATNSHAFPLLPVDLAWLFATRPVFLYPDLLPVCSLDHIRHHRSVYTPGEDGLIILGLKHFEGTLQSDQLISSYLLCKSRWNFRKHVREMSGPRAPHSNVIKMFLTQRVVPPLPLACSRLQSGNWCPPVDRNTTNMPNWLKNSRTIIQKFQLNSTSYPASLPPGCTLRLHPYWLNKSRPPPPPRRRLFTLAHNASLLPLAKAPAYKQVDSLPDRQTARAVKRQSDRQVDTQVGMQPISYLSLPPASVTLLSEPSTVSPTLPPSCSGGAAALTALHTVATNPVCADLIHSCLPAGRRTQQSVSRQQDCSPVPLLLPLPSLTKPDSTNAIMPCSGAAVKPGYFLLQMVWSPLAPSTTPPTITSQHALDQIQSSVQKLEQMSSRLQPQLEEEKHRVEKKSSAPASAPTSPTVCAAVEEEEEEEEKGEKENWTVLGVVSFNGGENNGREEGGREEQSAGGGGEEETDGGGDGEQGGDGEEEGQREDGGGEREDDGEKDKDDDHDRHGEDEEEEDFDDLTQDEDEEEVMSSASEESVLSVPELQETMKQLTWLAAERRLCADGDSEEDHSPTSPGSQEEEEEEEEEGPKGEESRERRSGKERRDEEMPSGEGTPRGGGRCPGRGRGRSQPRRGLKRSRQERHSKDASKLLLLYDENILDNDPHRESKDAAFAQSYLNRVREVLQDTPGQIENFVTLLNEFEHAGGQEMMLLFRKLRHILGDRTDLLRDFAAFLHPEQALQCGLFEEQQAFERSRRFLRQLEISFGDNPSHYQRIIKALQTGPDLSPTSIHELKAQMATLLKGHTHLQTEFWVFFEELRPPPARPGQFEEAHWPEDGGGGSDGGEGGGLVSGVGATSGFEEVTLPELEEEEEGHKIQPMTSRRQRRKMEAHRTYKDCDWSEKDWPCLCRDAKIRRYRRKGCCRCHGNKTSGVSRAMKSLDPLYSQISSTHNEPGDKDLELKGDDDSPQPDQSGASWEGSFPLTDEKEEEELDDEEDDEDEEERKNSEKEQNLAVKKGRKEEAVQPTTSTNTSTSCSSIASSVTSSICTSTSAASSVSSISVCTSSSASSLSPSSSAPLRSTPPPDLPVCAKNISLTASGEKVILWTREADRVILTTCQQEGANQNTFQAISSLLGNKTPSEVSRRFRDLMRLFRTAARQTSSEDEAPPAETAASNEEED